MAEPQPKRLRDDAEFNDSNSKRHKPYNSILSLLDEEEREHEEPTEDLSAIFTTLQQELSSPTSAFDFDSPPFAAEEEDKTTTTNVSTSASGEEDDVNSVIRHLLEASDDELGIPNIDCNAAEIKSEEFFPFNFVDNGLWELEDVQANYYTVLQSELFM